MIFLCLDYLCSPSFAVIPEEEKVRSVYDNPHTAQTYIHIHSPPLSLCSPLIISDFYQCTWCNLDQPLHWAREVASIGQTMVGMAAYAWNFNTHEVMSRGYPVLVSWSWEKRETLLKRQGEKERGRERERNGGRQSQRCYTFFFLSY